LNCSSERISTQSTRLEYLHLLRIHGGSQHRTNLNRICTNRCEKMPLLTFVLHKKWSFVLFWASSLRGSTRDRTLTAIKKASALLIKQRPLGWTSLEPSLSLYKKELVISTPTVSALVLMLNQQEKLKYGNVGADNLTKLTFFDR
jgi:hypothetical protein